MIQSTITHYFEKEIQPGKQSIASHYFKKEVNIDWDEADNSYGEAVNNLQNQCIARICLEKLPESVLQKYTNKKHAAPVKTQPAVFEKCPKCKKNFKHLNSLNSHKSYCGKERDIQCAHCSYKTKRKINLIVHLSKIHQNGKNIHENKHDNHGSGKNTRFCQKCKETSESICPTKCEKCFGKLLYQCKKCAKLFKTSSLAGYHWYTRCGVKGYFNCTKCGFKSVWRSKVAQHMKLRHRSSDSSEESEYIEWISLNQNNAGAESNTYKCPKCNKPMENFTLMKRHIQVCGAMKCENNSRMESKNIIDDHRHIEPEAIKCLNCGEHFDHIYALNVHIRCCKKKYLTKITNESDVEVVETNEDNPLQSFLSVDKRHARYTKMIVRYCRKCHEDSAIEEKNWGIGTKMACRKCQTTLLFKCTKCLKEYSKYYSVKTHLDTSCNPRDEFKCSKCNYKGRTQKLVKGHYDSVHGTENAKCEKCGIKFKSKEYLRKHLLRCGIAAKFQCEHCPFKSKLKVYLRKHIFRSHVEPVVVDRKDMIKISWQRFSRATCHLTAHCSKCKNEQRLGHRLKTCRKCKTKLYYKCKTCKRKYDVDDEDACQHVKAYLETIKFECKRCGRGMISEKSLWMHERTCAAKASFKCRFCKYAANIKGNVTKHEKVKHPHKFEI